LHVSDFDEVIELNVSGTLFTTYKNTLCKYSNSVLAQIFSGKVQLGLDNENRYIFCSIHFALGNFSINSTRYFLDRPASSFKWILSFLQTGERLMPESPSERALLEHEVACR